MWTKRWLLLDRSKEKIGFNWGVVVDHLVIMELVDCLLGHTCDKVFNLYFESQSTIVSLGL